MKFKYKPHSNLVTPDGNPQTFPLLKVTLKHGRSEVIIDCLLDSGASESLFGVDIATVLNIDLSKAPEQDYTGIGDSEVKGYRHPVLLKVSGFDTWITINAGFVEQNEMPLLGHSGFFENHEITFRAGQNRFEVKNIGSKSLRMSN